MTTTNTSSSPKLTLWVWPTGLYPRRVVYYLKAKALPQSALENLTVIPVAADFQAGKIDALPGFEARPTGTSLPALRVDDQIIYQSSSILNYLEHTYGPSLSGGDAYHRAHVADIVQHINEASIWTSVYLRHTHPMATQWMGMAKEQQSVPAGEDALKQWRNAMTKLETWVKRDIVKDKARSIAGGNEPTLADFTLMAARDYFLEMFGWNIFEGFEVLNEWYERARQCSWYIDRAGCEKLEKEGLGALFKD